MLKLSALGRGILALLGYSVLSCSEHATGVRPPRPDEIPALQTISAGKVVVGLELGSLRREQNVPEFRVTKNPISVRHYRECVAASACDRPALNVAECRSGTESNELAGSTFERADEDELPVTCLRPEQAANYCHWIGGKIPDSTQWLAAARGPSIRRFAWGSQLSDCAQHPQARVRGQRCERTTIARFRVGTHPAGASPTGVEDVLLTPAELVAASHDAFFAVCGDGASACLAKGLNPGAIDGFGPLPRSGEAASEATSMPIYGFRCVLEAK